MAYLERIMMDIPGSKIQYEDGQVVFQGEKLDSRHFIEPLRPCNEQGAAVDVQVGEMILEVRRILHRELVEGWPANGEYGFQAEFGGETWQELQRALQFKKNLKIAFFGSGFGMAIKDVFELPEAGKVEIHEFCLTDEALRRNPRLRPHLDSGRLIVHAGPLEFVPMGVRKLDFIFSRLGPFYHGLPHLALDKIKKTVEVLAVGGEAYVGTKIMDEQTLVDFLGADFEVGVVNVEGQSMLSDSRRFYIRRVG